MSNHFVIESEGDIESYIPSISNLIVGQCPKIELEFPTEFLMEIFMNNLLNHCELNKVDPSTKVELVCNIRDGDNDE